MSARRKALLPFDEEGFNQFWTHYLRKEAKQDAFAAWCQMRPDAALVIDALTWQNQQENWRDRRFIPMPATYIRGQRWTDERPPQKTPWCVHIPQCLSEQNHRRKLARDRGDEV